MSELFGGLVLVYGCDEGTEFMTDDWLGHLETVLGLGKYRGFIALRLSH
jgi:hypothetical protein